MVEINSPAILQESFAFWISVYLLFTLGGSGSQLTDVAHCLPKLPDIKQIKKIDL
jgi:hypothetical protein